MATESCWEGLPPELLEIIVRKLSDCEAARFSAVCTSWLAVVKTARVFHRLFRLSISSYQSEINALYGSHQLSLRLNTFAEGKLSSDSVVRIKGYYHDSQCVGSSKNLLVLQDKKMKTEILLLNPFSLRKFRLPSLDTLRSVKRDFMEKVLYPDAVHIRKAVILFMPKKRNYGPNVVLAIISSGTWSSSRSSSRSSLNYYRNGSWVTLESDQIYVDIVGCETRLYAMTFWGSVEAWDFNQSNSKYPSKVICFVPSEILPGDLAVTRYERRYLVESMGEFFLVRAFFEHWGYFAHGKTNKFEVYKCCLGYGEKWKKVESLGDDMALFLGATESKLVSIENLLPEGCEGNSIYFTDDHGIWTNSRGLKFYSLEHKKIKTFSAVDDDIVADQPATWIVRI